MGQAHPTTGRTAVSSETYNPWTVVNVVFDHLAAELQGYLDRLKTIIETDVPAFNRTVKQQDIPAVLAR